MPDIKLINAQPIESINTNNGELFIYPNLSFNDISNISNDVGTDIKRVKPAEYVKSLLRSLCHFERNLLQDRSKPNKPSLTKSDVENLTEKELDELVSIYLAHNKIYHRENKQRESETNKEYLYRLAIIQQKKIQEAADKAIGKYPNLLTISDDITQQISSSLLAAQSLQDSTSHTDRITNSSTLAIESLRVQLSINEAIISSGKETSHLTRIGIGLTVVVIVISVLSIVFIAPSSQDFISAKADALAHKLEIINSSINTKYTNETEQLSSLLQKQKEQLGKLSEKNISQEKIILDLENRLKILEQTTKREVNSK